MRELLPPARMKAFMQKSEVRDQKSEVGNTDLRSVRPALRLDLTIRGLAF
jgi:hypothetical protein